MISISSTYELGFHPPPLHLNLNQILTIAPTSLVRMAGHVTTLSMVMNAFAPRDSLAKTAPPVNIDQNI